MTRTLSVRVNAEGLISQADRLTSIVARSRLALAAVDAVNLVTTRAEKSLRAGEIVDINLTDAYVRSKTDVALAATEPRAEVTTRGDLTIMGRYPYAPLVQLASQARGDASRGIPPGSKAAGVYVQIKRSAATFQPNWFTMRLRAGAQPGTNVGVFVRTGRGRGDVKHLYGPSPYSLFRFQLGEQLESIASDLARTSSDLLGDRLGREV